MAVFAPMPSASVMMAMSVNPGDLVKVRTPYLRSRQNDSMAMPPRTRWWSYVAIKGGGELVKILKGNADDWKQGKLHPS
jgi:hypothetical protein